MTPEPGEARYLFFESFRLDCRTGELRKSGRRVRLQAQPARVLVLLATRAGELVSRTEIQESLWGDDTFVDFEKGINFSIRQIRDALGDSAENPCYVETVPRAGYRFIAPTEGPEPARRGPEGAPYPGLLSFSSNDAEFFFGREEEVQTLWAKLERRHLLALIGPSGAGKSSLLQAGLLPGRPPGWGALVVRPRESPFATLASALSAELGRAEEARRASDPEEVGALLQEWRRAHREALLCIDAFEELFTLSDEATRTRFSELLGKAVESGVHLLVAMRDDFFVHCHDYAELEPVFMEVTPLKPPRGPALRRALVEPAQKCGYRFEDEALVADILAEVTNERGALSLLAFAAARLWEKRDRNRSLLTRKAYLEIGGVGGALAQHAEETLAAIGQERQPVVREIIRNLTTARGTRAAQGREELLSVFEDREGAATVLGKLIDARLLTSTDREVEIVHESLLSAWPRLVRWQAQDAEGAVLRDQLRQAARAWQDRGKPDDRLWTGTSFRELALWRERYAGGLTATEQAFVDASSRLSERKRRRRRIALTSLVAATLAVAAITSSLWRKARAEALRAEASKLLALAELRLQEDPTEALAFATASLGVADSREARTFVMKALWEAPPALELRADSQAARVPRFSPDGKLLATAGHSVDALVWSQDGEGPLVLPGHETSPRGPNRALWSSNELLVTGLQMFGSRVHLWSLPEGRHLRTIDFGGPSVWQVSTENVLLETHPSASAANPHAGLLRSWALPEGEPTILGRVDFSKLGTQWTFDPAGRNWLYIRNRNVYARPLPSGTGPDHLIARLTGDAAVFWTTTSWLTIADTPAETHIWSYPSEGPPRSRVVPRPDWASSLTLPDASIRWLAGDPASDQQIRLRDLVAWNAARPLSLRRAGSWYLAVATFHPKSDWVVASTETFTRLTFWPLRKIYPAVVSLAGVPYHVGGYTTHHRPLAFSPDSKWLATMWEGRLRLWPLAENPPSEVRSLELPPSPSPVRSLAFDPESRYVFATGGQDRANVVPLDGSPPRAFQRFSEDTALHAAAVSPGGRFAATAYFYGQGEKTLRVWDLETGGLRRFELAEGPGAVPGASGRTGYEGGILSAGFADESTLYTAGDGGLRRWNLETGSQEIVVPASPGHAMSGTIRAEKGLALTLEARLDKLDDCRRALLHDLSAGTSRELTEFGDCSTWSNWGTALDASGTVAAIGSEDGVVRVGRLDAGEPHLLIGHRGPVDRIAISPDLRWVATTGEDNTLRLWPMPDLSKPPLHTLSHDELLAKLRSLTNLRAVRDPSTATGWKVEVGPFPGWKTVPIW